MVPTFFKTPHHFRRWLQKNHASASELWIGFYRKASGRGGLTYEQALEEALCFGWIDGVRKRFDDEAYVQRFTPRTSRSYWSAVNIKRVEGLVADGRMHEAGLAAFERRDKARTEAYSFERENAKLDRAQQRQFRANDKAWTFFESQPPGYRRLATHYVNSAKKEETRQRRLETLIRDSAAGRRIGVLKQN